MLRHALLLLAVALPALAGGPTDEAKKDLKAFQGTWVLASGEDDGKKLSADALKSARLTVEGDRHTVHVGKTTYKGKHKLDPTKRPKTIDITDTEGPFAGKTVLGIYELTADEFRLCYAPPGMDRPKDFSAKAGTGLHAHVWKRHKD